MLSIRTSGLALIVSTAAGLAGRPAAAQDPCPYIRCFLSVRRDPPRLVQGAAGTPIAWFGVFAPRIDLLATSSDSVRLHYAAFRAAYNRGRTAEVIGFAAFITGFIVVVSHPTTQNLQPSSNVGTGLGIVAGGGVAELVGLVFHSHAERQLEQALAIYNRSLPDSR